MANDLTPTIETVAGVPMKSEVDGALTQEHPLPDLIEADRYLKSTTAASKRGRGLRFTKMIPPGSVCDLGGTSGGVD